MRQLGDRFVAKMNTRKSKSWAPEFHKHACPKSAVFCVRSVVFPKTLFFAKIITCSGRRFLRFSKPEKRCPLGSTKLATEITPTLDAPGHQSCDHFVSPKVPPPPREEPALARSAISDKSYPTKSCSFFWRTPKRCPENSDEGDKKVHTDCPTIWCENASKSFCTITSPTSPCFEPELNGIDSE